MGKRPPSRESSRIDAFLLLAQARKKMIGGEEANGE
jgi:hypothetical protein